MAASTKMAAFWVVASITILIMKVANTSETSLHFFQITRRNNPEGSHLL
jgi:hypothetical protein